MFVTPKLDGIQLICFAMQLQNEELGNNPLQMVRNRESTSSLVLPRRSRGDIFVDNF